MEHYNIGHWAATSHYFQTYGLLVRVFSLNDYLSREGGGDYALVAGPPKSSSFLLRLP